MFYLTAAFPNKTATFASPQESASPTVDGCYYIGINLKGQTQVATTDSIQPHSSTATTTLKTNKTPLFVKRQNTLNQQMLVAPSLLLLQRQVTNKSVCSAWQPSQFSKLSPYRSCFLPGEGAGSYSTGTYLSNANKVCIHPHLNKPYVAHAPEE